LSLTENGLGVADGVRGVTSAEPGPANGNDRAPGLADVHVDGVCPRTSGRPDLYPHAPMHYRGPQKPAAGRLDEVTAEPAPEPEAAPETAPPAPSGLQVPRSPLPPVLKPQAPAATE
jgi:hypothetical protein